MNASEFFNLSGGIKTWADDPDNDREVMDAVRDVATQAIERTLSCPPMRVTTARQRASVSREEEAWSGKSGRAGDGELLQSLEVTYTFPAAVFLQWKVGVPLALVKMVEGEYEYPREIDLTDLVSVDESAEYTPEDGPLDRRGGEYYAELRGQFARMELRADGENTAIFIGYTVSAKVRRNAY